MSDLTEVVIRPNGKMYKARKPCFVLTWLDGDYRAVAVFRTHDVKLARWLAKSFWGDLDSDTEIEDASVDINWWRLVPFDPSGEYDSSWIDDEVRGIPCVVFRVG